MGALKEGLLIENKEVRIIQENSAGLTATGQLTGCGIQF